MELNTISELKAALHQSQQHGKDVEALLLDAVKCIPLGFNLFDADERLVVSNITGREKSASNYQSILEPGKSQEEILREIAHSGLNAEAVGRENEWVEQRLKEFRTPGVPVNTRLSDGRCFEITTYKTSNGGTIVIRTDTTKKSATQAALRESEDRFRDITAATSDRFWETDENHRYTYVSEGKHLDFLPPESLIGKTICEAVGASPDEEPWRSRIADLDAHRPFRDFRLSRVLDDGTTAYIKVSGIPVFDADGTFRGYRGAVINETAEVEARERAATAEHQFMEAIEAAPEGIVLWDAEDRFVRCNGYYRELHPDHAGLLVPGLPYDTFIRKIAETAYIPETGGRRDQEAWIRTRLESRSQQFHELETFRNGRWIYVHVRRLADGSKISFFTETTERKKAELKLAESEERLIQAQRLAGLGYFELDLTNQSLYWSDEMYSIYGLSKIDTKISQELFLDLVYPDDRDSVVRAIEKALDQNEAQETEFRIRRPDGSIRHISLIRQAVRDDGGQPIKIRGALRDITESKVAQAALRESEDRFRDIATATSDRIWETDYNHRFTFISKGNLPGSVSPESLIGKNWWEAVDASPDEEPWRSHFAGLKAHRRFRDFRYKRVLDDGTTVYFKVSGVPVFDADGTFTGYRGAIVNETAEVAARERAETAEQQFMDAIEAAPVGVNLWDSEDRFVSCNGYCRELYPEFVDLLVPGLSFEELIRKIAETATIDEAGGKRDLEAWIRTRLEIRSQRYYELETFRNGRWIYVQVRRLADGSHITFFTDITDRKVAEAALRESERTKNSILNGAPDGIALFDLDGTFLEANETVASRQNVAVDEIIGKHVGDMYPPNIASNIISNFQKVIDTRTTVSDEYKQNDMAYEILYRPHFDDLGDVILISTFSRDITERKQLEARFAETQKMEAVGKLTAGVAHEFNNMLMAVTGNLELLVNKLEGSEDLTRLASSGLEAALRGGTLTQQLLSYTGKQIVAPKITDVNAFLSDTVELLRPSLGAELDLQTVFADDAWPVLVDQSQLQQAMLNLAVNARDAMPDGGKIMVETANIHAGAKYLEIHHADMSAGGYVRISVTDTGTGMPPEVIDKAFDPFFTTKNMAEGTGLGLSMVYGFIRKQSGGHIDIDSAVGIGTTVNLYLPRAEAVAEEQAEDSHDRPITGRGTILVVEDDTHVRELICDVALMGLGYRTYSAADGPAALAFLERSGPVDLLLIDIVLPKGMNGIELARRVEETSPATRMIFMTGYSDNEVEARGLTGDDIPVLRKPFSIKELAQVVADAIRI